MSAVWQLPKIDKIYEALGAVADRRVEVVEEGKSARVYSSSRGKYYDITYEASTRSIMSNDNSSYWTGTLGYPAIAFLLCAGELTYRAELGELLKGVPWKDLNQKNKNNFAQTTKEVLAQIPKKERELLIAYAETLLQDVTDLQLKKLGRRTTPPKGY